ncbi:MAG TPA: carboxypeptidase-like regulatory domain-containing protein [Pyrinomonadaceae bacterium]|nr:carboxypeptidase-like regulatory domain-containing protein [Pyrinomonadaceae bacterium]
MIATALFGLTLSATLLFGQQSRGGLRGVVKDELGGLISGATVTLTAANGEQKTTTANANGEYVFDGLTTGQYNLAAVAKGFAATEQPSVEITANRSITAEIILKVAIAEQRVNVNSDQPISVEATNNGNQTVVAGNDLEALPDNPDELAAALQALAGPPVGPATGGDIYVDGFSGGSVPPKSSIREVRINQNPFAAENDQPSTRTDILTKPGTDKYHAGGFFNFDDESLNSRNPFAATRSPFQIRYYGGNFSGPVIKKKASFFFNSERQEIDDNELVKATILDAKLNRVDEGFGVVVPRRTIFVSPRLDYQLNEQNTLVARYQFYHQHIFNSGVGGFSLPERAYNVFFNQDILQLTETAVLSPTVINEARFQYLYSQNENRGDTAQPGLNVSGAFVSGGSQVGDAFNTQKRWELNDFAGWQKKTHTVKFGGRLRDVRIDDLSPANFGGTYTFAGALVPQLDANNNPIPGAAPIFAESLERYRRTLLFQGIGLSPAQVRALGGGASQFSISAGNALATVSQFDVGFFGQDDWKVRPNLLFSYGVRYEHQTNTHSPNFAPRIAFAWSPASNKTGPPKTVIRFGVGIFYNRFGERNTLQANRFNGVNTEQFTVAETPLYVNGVFVAPMGSPLDAFPNVPALSSLNQSRQIRWQVDPQLHTPTFFFQALQLERQLPRHTTLTTGAYFLHIAHAIRARDINQPLPGTITATNPQGVRPFGNVGEIYQYESTGSFNQEQIFVSVNSRFNKAISFFASYNWGKSNNNTDGQGSTLFPVNSYDLSGEYGRSTFDFRHRLSMFGTLNLPWWGISLNPFINAGSGQPVNIITGQDTNGDNIFTERPSFAPAGVNCAAPPANIVCTSFGNFNLRPAVGERLIPRNYGSGPGYFSVNLRVTKSWSFGDMSSKHHASAATPADSKSAAAPAKGPAATPEAKRYTLQASLNFLNLFNNVNLGQPVGNLSSPFFGQSTYVNQYGGFGPSGSQGAGNRRIFAQLRLSF